MRESEHQNGRLYPLLCLTVKPIVTG